MNTRYHPKNGVIFKTTYVKLTLENPDPKHDNNNISKPLCREFVKDIEIPFSLGDGTFRYVPLSKEFLTELLEYAKEIENKEPINATPDITAEEFQSIKNLFANIKIGSRIDPVEEFMKNSNCKDNSPFND
jgi:hypothetical protein